MCDSADAHSATAWLAPGAFLGHDVGSKKDKEKERSLCAQVQIGETLVAIVQYIIVRVFLRIILLDTPASPEMHKLQVEGDQVHVRFHGMLVEAQVAWNALQLSCSY